MLQYELLNLLLFFIQSGVHFFDSRSSVYLSLCISLSLSLSAFQLNAIVFIGMTVQYNITQALKQ